MPLWDVTGGGRAKPVDPAGLETSDYFQALKRKAHPRTFERILQTADEAVDFVVKHGQGKLIWTKAGAIFGHGSLLPKRHVDHLWESVTGVFGDGRESLITVGCLLRWAIARRAEKWLLWVRVTDKVDPETDQIIKISEYWIKDDFVVPQATIGRAGKVAAVTQGVEELRKKWGSR